MTQYAVGPQVTQVWAGGGPVLLANQDLVNPVTIGDQPGVFIDSPAAVVIPPLGSIGLLGRRTLYAIAPAGTAALMVIAGGTSWAPSPADVALQIQDLGLAKDTTLQGLPDQMQLLGIPSFVPNIASASKIGQGNQVPTGFFNFTSAARIWAAHLSFAVASNSSYTGGTTQLYSQIITGSGVCLSVVELAIGGPQDSDSGDADLTILGLEVAQGEVLKLDVNNGVAMTQGSMHASCVVLYSVP